ncbi:MAG: hypothetical protein ACRBBW_03645 [Cellvibrionaceae bacterium]
MPSQRLLKLSTSLITALLLSTSGTSFASADPTALNPRDVIDDYRILRSSCAQMQGNERRDCFSRLNQQTEQYQNAKERIKSAQMLGLRITSR